MSDVTFKTQIGDELLYSACARLNVQQLSAKIADMVHGHSRSGTSFIELGTVTSSVTSL